MSLIDIMGYDRYQCFRGWRDENFGGLPQWKSSPISMSCGYRTLQALPTYPYGHVNIFENYIANET